MHFIETQATSEKRPGSLARRATSAFSTNNSTASHRQSSSSGPASSPKLPANANDGSYSAGSSGGYFRRGSLPAEPELADGIVDMDAFGQILALDDGDPAKEFSKALIWAWCDQAELAIEEIDAFIAQDNLQAAASKAHYLKGSSSSLGLVKVSLTCQALFRIHFPPGLAQLRTFSYQLDYSSGNRSSSSSSESSSASTPGLSPSPLSPCPSLSIDSPQTSPQYEMSGMNFAESKINNARALLTKLTAEIKEATEWLYKFYREADKFSGVSPPI